MAAGREHVIDVQPTLASEDFSIIMDRVLSFFYWIGSGRSDQPVYAWHQSRFVADDHLASEDSMESVDIFETAMQNCFSEGKVLIDGILDGTL